MFKYALISIFACCAATLMATNGRNIIDFPLSLNDINSNEDLSFVKIGRISYLIEGEQLANWFEAAHICRTYKAQLASLESLAEIDALSRYLVDNGHKSKWFWLSGNDLIAKGSFSWLGTGNDIRYAKWQPGKPDNASNAHCLNIWRHDNGNIFTLNNYDCKEKSHYICEKYC